jgi:hypothetical protein
MTMRAIPKLSDADLPLVAGWQTIVDGNTPFDAAGLCDFRRCSPLWTRVRTCSMAPCALASTGPKNMARYADEPHELERVPIAVNGKTYCYYRSTSFWKASAAVNLPRAIERTYSASLNGFESRCSAYTCVLYVTGDTGFPTKNGGESFIPDGGIIRR